MTLTAFAPRATFASRAGSAASATNTPSRITTAADRRATAIASVAGYRTLASIAAVTGHGLLLTAHQDDPDEREKDRDAQYDNSIHAESSKESTLVETHVAMSGT